jgi:preprotein translocase subunit SecE
MALSPPIGIEDMANTGPIEFMKQVRAEAEKVVWPTRKETFVTTLMVVLMAFFASMFFLLSDQVISRAVGFILSLGQ